MYKILIGLGVVVLLGAGTVVGANGALPGDLLYGVKLGVNERVEGMFKVGGQARANWHVALTERRLNEAVNATLENQFDQAAQETVLNDFNAHMKALEDYIAEKNASEEKEQVKEISLKLAQVLASYTSILNDTQKYANENPETASVGSLDFLSLRVGNSLAAAANIAVSTLIEDPAPEPTVDPSTVDEWGRPI